MQQEYHCVCCKCRHVGVKEVVQDFFDLFIKLNCKNSDKAVTKTGVESVLQQR